MVGERVVSGALHLPHVSSHYQLADPFTKAMTKSTHVLLVSKLTHQASPHQFEGECKDTKANVQS